MKYFFIILIMSILGNNKFKDMGYHEETLATFGFMSHVTSDGKPSRYDREYLEYVLKLFDDRSFIYSFQQGRLEPTIEAKTGNWKINNDKLILSYSEITYTDYYNKQIKDKFIGNTYFVINEYKLCEIGGERCLRHYKGISVKDLFLKYK